MLAHATKVVLCAGARTPIGHFARSLASYHPQDLMLLALEAALAKAKVSKEKVDGLIVGWVGQSFDAPNLARVTLLRAGLPERGQAVTVQNNCVSSIEAVAAAARAILSGEGQLYVAGGTECMSCLPYLINGTRADKELRSLETVKSHWGDLLAGGRVGLVDSLEQGLTDPVRGITMAGTAEVCAQMFDIPREAQDAYALESLRRAIEGWNRGFYASHVSPVVREGKTLLEKDEYPFLREDLLAKPQHMAKAPAAFDHGGYPLSRFYQDFGRFIGGKTYAAGISKGTVTLFNSCSRSDGAAAVVVASAERADELGLEVLAELKGWGFYGNDPSQMGISPALAAPVALKRAGWQFGDLDSIELHEPFAATVLSVFAVGKERFGHDWAAKYKAGRLNPNGGSIALGHPLGATGVRLLLNLLHSMKETGGRRGMLAACAGGGMGGAMVVERA